jgi:uncharacterized protein YbjT (DUF2867 family)
MIAVLGATGFVGAALTRQLAAGPEPVRALVRDRAKALERLGEAGEAVELVVGDMHDEQALAALLDGVRAVYVLVQTVTARQPAGAGDYAEAERRAVAGIAAAARRAGVARLLTVGLIGARPDAHNPWVRSRARIEADLLASGLAVTVLRAGLVVGAGGAGFDRLASAASRRLAVILGSGTQRWSYIALPDLVGYLIDAADEPSTAGRVLDVGSTETPTYRELLARTSQVLGTRSPRVLALPLPLVTSIAPALELLGRLPRGGLRNAISHLGDDLVGDTSAARELMPRDLLGWEESVRVARSLDGVAASAGEVRTVPTLASEGVGA